MYKVNRSAITTSAITTGLHMLLFTESHLMSPLWHYKFRIFYFLVELDIIGKSKYTSFQCYNSSLSVQQWLKKGRLKLSFLFETRVEVSACVQMLGASSSFCPLVDAVVAFFFRPCVLQARFLSHSPLNAFRLMVFTSTCISSYRSYGAFLREELVGGLSPCQGDGLWRASWPGRLAVPVVFFVAAHMGITIEGMGGKGRSCHPGLAPPPPHQGPGCRDCFFQFNEIQVLTDGLHSLIKIMQILFKNSFLFCFVFQML